MQSKICTRCKNTKPLSAFVQNKANSAWCKECRNAISRENYQKRKKHYADYQRKYKKSGTYRFGEEHSRAILKEENIKEIFWLYYAHEISQSYLASYYGISQRAIYAVLHRQSWKHVGLGNLLDDARKYRETLVILPLFNAGFFQSGENHVFAKLTKLQVEQIIYLRYAENLTLEALSHQFNVSESNISAIIKGRIWKEIDREPIIYKAIVKALQSKMIKSARESVETEKESLLINSRKKAFNLQHQPKTRGK